MESVKLYDDCDWQNIYPAAHVKQTIEIEDSGSIMEVPLGTTIVDGKIILSTTDKTIHPNHIYIMEKIAELLPSNIFEVGFGYANNLVNIDRILPNINKSGCDISWKQHYTALRRYKECANFNLVVGDFLELDIPNNSFDFVFSNAVLMHMSTERAMTSLIKMINISKKYVLLLEGGLYIQEKERFISNFPKIILDIDFADRVWGNTYKNPPILIEKI